MRKILIGHASNTLNYGSAMMAINLISGLRERLGQQIEIFCDCDAYHLERLKRASGDPGLKGFLAKNPDPNRPIIRKVWDFLSGRSIIVREISGKFDTMIVLGGDDLSETYFKVAILRGLLYWHINRSCHVILAGQSIGPFTGIYKLMASLIFRQFTVITRDDNSFDFCKNELNLPDVYKSRDLAIYPLPNQNDWNDIYGNMGLQENGYVVVVPSGLVSKYTDDKAGYIETWSAIIRRVMEMDNLDKVVLLAHVLSPEGSSDVPVIEELLDSFSAKEKARIVACVSPIQPAEARALLGGSWFVVTGRMHAALSTFHSGKPAISLAYSEKYAGVIGRGLDLAELIIDCRNRQWGFVSDVVREVEQVIDTVINNHDDLCEKINNEIHYCSKVVEYHIATIAKLVC